MLWRSYPLCSCEQTEYRSALSVDSSDHKPVSAAFLVRVMRPSETEESMGDRHEWELNIASTSCTLPLAYLDEEDANIARMAETELLIEFHGDFIRTGYETPRVVAEYDREGDGGRGSLSARWASKIALPLTDLYHKFGPQRMMRCHLVLQVVMR